MFAIERHTVKRVTGDHPCPICPKRLSGANARRNLPRKRKEKKGIGKRFSMNANKRQLTPSNANVMRMIRNEKGENEKKKSLLASG